MKMNVNWQAIINFILFAMIVTAFVFAIWSYVKTNTIKNSNSGSVPSVINDNNTYVNNIASAPNLVTFDLGIADKTYAPQSTDNGSTMLLKSSAAGLKANFNIGAGVKDSKNSLVAGYYINVINGNLTGGNDIAVYSNDSFGGPMLLKYTLTPGESAYYYQLISDVNNAFNFSTGWNSSV
jgi:hypothetical protein